jgi:hypothetical protein
MRYVHDEVNWMSVSFKQEPTIMRRWGSNNHKRGSDIRCCGFNITGWIGWSHKEFAVYSIYRRLFAQSGVKHEIDPRKYE